MQTPTRQQTVVAQFDAGGFSATIIGSCDPLSEDRVSTLGLEAGSVSFSDDSLQRIKTWDVPIVYLKANQDVSILPGFSHVGVVNNPNYAVDEAVP